jgi:hypothetical protein
MTRTEPPVQSMSRVEYANIVQRAARLFSLMRPVIDSPDSRLKGYRNDFYVHDRDYLRSTHATGQYLWIVRENGTELRKLGLHPSENDWLQATMNVTAARDIYVVDADRMTVSNVLDDTHAEQLMGRFRYSMQDGVISKDGVSLAHASTELVAGGGGERGRAHVTLTSLQPVPDSELPALLRLAEIQAREQGQSLFTPVERVILDGQDLYAMLAPVVAALDSRSTWYGVIKALPDEADFLRLLKVELAPFDHQVQGFPARLSGEAMANLEPYASSMQWDLHRLPWTVKPEGSIEPVKPLSRLTASHLRAYDAYLSWHVASGDAAPAVVSAIGGLAVENARRVAPRARHATTPGGTSLALS